MHRSLIGWGHQSICTQGGAGAGSRTSTVRGRGLVPLWAGSKRWRWGWNHKGRVLSLPGQDWNPWGRGCNAWGWSPTLGSGPAWDTPARSHSSQRSSGTGPGPPRSSPAPRAPFGPAAPPGGRAGRWRPGPRRTPAAPWGSRPGAPGRPLMLQLARHVAHLVVDRARPSRRSTAQGEPGAAAVEERPGLVQQRLSQPPTSCSSAGSAGSTERQGPAAGSVPRCGHCRRPRPAGLSRPPRSRVRGILLQELQDLGVPEGPQGLPAKNGPRARGAGS